MLSFFFIDAAPTGIYTLSLHDALPILTVQAGTATAKLMEQHAPSDIDLLGRLPAGLLAYVGFHGDLHGLTRWADRKSTRLNSSHGYISYAVFCLKKKKRNHARHDLTSV